MTTTNQQALPTLTHAQARIVMLAATGLMRRPRRRATKAEVLECIRQMSVLQIDTISVVARSPYFVLWGRLGDYDPRWLEELLAEGQLFEYWSHEASFLPIEDYELYRYRMLDPPAMGWKYSHAWLERHQSEIECVLARIREHGPARSADFARTDGKASGWWEWKPEKRALEYLFTSGELMIARRQNFQRLYELRERVLPATWDDAQTPPRAEALRQLALKAVRALGVTAARWVADYFRTGKRETETLVRELADAGELLTVRIKEWEEPAYVHPERRELIEAAARGRLRPSLTTLLSPFDPLVWDRARARAMFDFDYRLECYTPAAKRRYGYFTLPILWRGALVGRADAKAHRTDKVFEVKALYLEPGVAVTNEFVVDLSRALQECAAWHRTPEIVIRQTAPPMLTAPLKKALTQLINPGETR